MTAAVMVAAMAWLFITAQRCAARRGDDLTLFDPTMWVLASASVLVATFGSAHQLAGALTLAVGCVCALTDRQTGYIFNVVLATGSILLVPCVLVSGDLEGAVLGAGVCGGAMQFLHVATRGRGLGLGDVKYAAFIGGGLAPRMGLIALGAAFVAGSLFVLATTLVRRVRASGTIAFGPYLAVGAIVSVAFAEVR